MTTVSFTIPNINCNHCVHTIKEEVSELDGVKVVEGDLQQKQVTVTFDDPATKDGIIELLKEINYPPQV